MAPNRKILSGRKIARAADSRARMTNHAWELRHTDAVDRSTRDWFARIEAERERLLSDQTTIQFVDYGAGSKFSLRSAEEQFAGRTNTSTVADTCRRSSSKPLKARFIFWMIRQFHPRLALEMGTSVGISAAYQAAALWLNDDTARLITLEGASALATEARKTLANLGLDNAEVRIGPFRNTLGGVLAESPVDYVYVDGHHDYTATLQYFDQLLPAMPDGGVLIFDDIRWNDRMEAAWSAISQDRRIDLAVDLEKYGVVFVAG